MEEAPIKKRLTHKQIAKMGGDKLRDTRGPAYYAEISKLGKKVILANDPNYYLKLAASGMYARQVKLQNFIQSQLEEEKREAPKSSRLSRITNALMGKKG